MLANFQFQVHVQLAAGKVLLVIDICVGSPTSLAQHAHAHFHPSTTLLPSRDFPIQALLFPNSTSISFFNPPINTVFYLIERLRQYFILLNDVIKNRKRRACVEANDVIEEVRSCVRSPLCIGLGSINIDGKGSVIGWPSIYEIDIYIHGSPDLDLYRSYLQ